jgi:DNA-binding IclR family transcriptional regulator
MPNREHSLRQQLATEHRRRNPDPDRIAELQRERAVVRIEEFAAEVFAAAPPLHDDQRQHLAAVMLGGNDEAA